ncbi:hypothetical protein [Brevibacillus sp. NRS-1366]|uniref:hypothetical protein n=1 Tax=Brevibacillus sp. NRS-1366 TaxID=3233899 RepID=UPI003D1F9216
MNEVVTFFEEKGIFPRLYIYHSENQDRLLEVLQRHGFRIESLPSSIQLWQDEFAVVDPSPSITIEPVTMDNYNDCLLVESVPELGGREMPFNIICCA